MLPVRNYRNQTWLPTLFNELFDDWTPTVHTTPAFNVVEDAKSYKVEVAAPGMTKDDFKIHLNDKNQLIVHLEKKSEDKQNDNERRYLRHEFSYTTFEQSLILPDTVNKQGITAAMQDGVLTITLPKKTPEQKEAELQYIEIK
ncbi:MAG: Hsp20/alpha crystallin family protein [Bacteroidaceae bacterium]|nr:Hsp20/alpha crystallin family protein [Bacteroidaceae bacterium]